MWVKGHHGDEPQVSCWGLMTHGRKKKKTDTWVFSGAFLAQSAEKPRTAALKKPEGKACGTGERDQDAQGVYEGDPDRCGGQAVSS